MEPSPCRKSSVLPAPRQVPAGASPARRHLTSRKRKKNENATGSMPTRGGKKEIHIARTRDYVSSRDACWLLFLPFLAREDLRNDVRSPLTAAVCLIIGGMNGSRL